VEHSSENGLTWDRFEVDSVVTQQDLVDSYMPAFQARADRVLTAGADRVPTTCCGRMLTVC